MLTFAHWEMYIKPDFLLLVGKKKKKKMLMMIWEHKPYFHTMVGAAYD